MGRRKKRRKVIKIVRRLPKLFQCPSCGQVALTIDVDEVETESGLAKAARIICNNPSCCLRAELTGLPMIFEAVDAYHRFLDLYNTGEVGVRFECAAESEERRESE
ncbi:MAG: transcription elongation factor [Sulfolobales archaeon]|nr:transcription elongation factor [Sulfolobales archaeon]MCX8208903.1 transcription elongation factor [Sulfolobales archaeon]MDW8010812.1 transcription elongation factor [Sulfolobales archaeon]